MSFRPTSNNRISLAHRLKALRKALAFGKSYPITKGVGNKAQSLTLTLPPPANEEVMCQVCGGVKGRK